MADAWNMQVKLYIIYRIVWKPCLKMLRHFVMVDDMGHIGTVADGTCPTEIEEAYLISDKHSRSYAIIIA